MHTSSVPVLMRLPFWDWGVLDFIRGERVEYRCLDGLTSGGAGEGLVGLVCLTVRGSLCFIVFLSIRTVGWGCTICTIVPCQLNCSLPQYTPRIVVCIIDIID